MEPENADDYGNNVLQDDLIAEVNLSNVLANLAEKNKCYLFTCEDLAHALHLSIDAIYAAKRAGAPFPFGKSRPEWVLEFLRTSTGGSLSIKSSREPVSKAIAPTSAAAVAA